MSYSTLMTNIWPPPNDEVRSRLERLQELKQLREKRESSSTLPPRTDGGDSEGSRLSRRQLLNTRTLPTSRLREKQGERLKATLEKKSQGYQSSTSQEENGRSDYGGARPKNFSASLRGNSSETSEILASIRKRETDSLVGRERQRTTSADSDTFEDHGPSNNVINRATSARLTSIGSLGSLGDELEADIKTQDVSVESESADHTEDIESFKQSLYGTTQTKATQQEKVLVPFTDPSSLIDPSKLSNRIMTPSKSESKGKLGDSARWRKNVPQSKEKPTIVNGEKNNTSQEQANLVISGNNVEGGGLDSNMETSTVMSGVSSENVTEQQSESGKALVFDGENLTMTGGNESNTETLLGHDTLLSEHAIETNGEDLGKNDSLLNGLSDRTIHGSFTVSHQMSDFSVPSSADNLNYKDSILNESDSIFDSAYENVMEEDTFSDRDPWQSDQSFHWGRESSTSHRGAWQTDRPSFDRSSGYAPKQSRRDVLTANRTKQPTTRITRYASLPSSADSRVSEFRSRYLNRDYPEPYTSSYGDESSMTTSYRDTKQEDISSRLGNILSDSFKKFDSVLDGNDVQRRHEDSSRSLRRTEEPSSRSLRRSYSHRVESDTDSRLGRYRRTSETNSDNDYRSQHDSPSIQPDLGMHDFISNIRSRMSGMNPMSESRNKPLARSVGPSSVLENAKRMLLGITDEPEVSYSDEQFKNLRLQTERLTESLVPKEENENVTENLNSEEISEGDVQPVTEVVLEKGNIIQLTPEPDKQLDNNEKESENIKNEESTLVNRTTSNSSPVLENLTESVESETKKSAPVDEAELVKNSENDSQSEIAKSQKTSDSSSKKQMSSKGKNKKKKRGKKKKDSDNKSDTSSNIDSKSLDGKKIEISQSEDILTVTIEDSNTEEDKQKSTGGSPGNQLQSMISDIDNRSEKTSVATEELLSLNGKGEGSESVSSKSESSVSKATSCKSNDDRTQTSVSQIPEENFDLQAETMNQEIPTERISQLQSDMEQFETASEEEFYEATPGEDVDEEGNVFVEHREKFIHVTAGSKVRKRKLSKKTLLGEKHSEEVKQEADVDSSRLGHVKEWMDNNIFPSNNTVHEKDLGVKSSDHGSQLSVNSTLGDFDSRGSLGSKEMLEDGKTVKNEPVHTSETPKSSTVLEKRNSSIQTNVSLLNMRDSGTQMLIKSRNIGVQIDSELYDKFVQTPGELVCPCCNNKINIQEGFVSSAKDRDVQKVKEELKLKLGVENKEQNKEERSISSSDTSTSSKSSSLQNSVATSPKNQSVTSSTKRSPAEKSSGVTSGKQNSAAVKRNHSAREMTTRKSPATTPRRQSPTRKSPASTPRKQSPSRKSPATTPRKQSPSRKSPATTPRKQSPLRKSPASTPRKQSPSRKSPATTPRKQSPSRKSPATTPRKQSPSRKSPATSRRQSPVRDDATTPKGKKTLATNSAGKSNGEVNIGGSKARREKVPSIQDLLYENGEQTAEKKPEMKRRPTTPKPGKREKSLERMKREGSVEGRSDDGVGERNDLPGYMQPTKSSRRKKSIGDSEELFEESKQKKGTPTTPRKTVTERDDEQEGFTTMTDNPFIRSDRQRTSVGGNGQRSSGKWYRKEPLKNEEESKKGKTRTPKKSRSTSTSSTSSEKNLVNGNSYMKSEKVLRSDERLDLSGLGSQSSLLETNLDEAMGYNDSRGETNQDSETTQEFIETIPYASSYFRGPDLKTYAENISKNIAEKEVLKLESDSNQTENTIKSSVKLSLPPPRAESEEKEAEVTQTLDGTEDSTAKQKLLSEEEQAGVPVETEEEQDEVAPVRVNLSNWDPTKLLKDLYAVQLMPDDATDISDKFVAMEGLMEKLPMNKKKATLLKTWKRRFFRAKDGWLYYYETSNRDKPSDTLQLMGGKVDDLGNRILGIDDGRGKYLMVRCPTDKEYGQWKLALESQTADNVKATYVRPVLSCAPHPQKKVILIDIGSSAIRAGILGEHATLPTLFFPNIVAHAGDSKELAVGIEAFKPEYRKTSSKIVHPTDKVDKDFLRPFSIDTSTIGVVFQKVFTDLKVEPADYWMMISTPQNLGDKIRAGLMETLIDKYHVQGVCMVMQSLLALYSYNATSGIIVDIGERMEILPIYDGFVIEGGVSRQSYGGQKVVESLNSCLQGYNFSTPIQQLLVRYVMEQSCYLVTDYKETLKKCEEDPDSYKATVYLNNFDLPEGATMEVTHDYSCFKSPEGFFNTDLWGMDYPCVHKLVFQAIQSCPIDSRKRMYRAIYLSGGVTRLPGFAERLQCELQKLAPPSVMVEVHASPQRYHSAFIGACSLANMEQFKQICISAEEWKKDGVKTFKKWNMAG